MRILVDNSGYALRNMGDLAMLQVALQRIRNLVPHAVILVLTSDPPRLRNLIDAVPIETSMRDNWKTARVLPFPIRSRRLPKKLQVVLSASEDFIRYKFPFFAAWSIDKLNRWEKGQCSEFVDLVKGCDLVVATGGGFMTDSFLNHANDVMSTLEIAQSLGKPTAMFGQGIGPLTCKKTLARLERIAPNMVAIGLRERQKGPDLLAGLGVPDSIVRITGDDAIEMAFNSRPENSGNLIGVNVRLANYSLVNESQKETIRNGLAKFLNERKLNSCAVPISFSNRERDSINTERMMEGIDGFQKRDISENSKSIVDSIQNCGMVVTGSYHAGVFALSQGISVVGLVASDYYSEKFFGLNDLFGIGCSIFDMRSNNSDELYKILNDTFLNLEKNRGALLDAAKIQIEKSKQLYSDVLRPWLG